MNERISLLSLIVAVSLLFTTTVIAETAIEKCFKNPDSCNLNLNIDEPSESASVQDAKDYINEIQTNIHVFLAIIDSLSKSDSQSATLLLDTVKKELNKVKKEKTKATTEMSEKFSTPIEPDNINFSVSSFRIAEINSFPKIPFYIPGTEEYGELFLMPKISDEGFLNYQLDFLDRSAKTEKVRDRLLISHENIDGMISGLMKVDEWTKVVQENNITRQIEKTSVCIPDGSCSNKVQGVKSSEIIFQIYEDGSTAGRIQVNKGKFSVKYNMSVESSLLLTAYLTYMRDVGSKEFQLGVMSDDEVKDLFE